ncbi:MAG: four helix bundle suffix domain-containing protein [Prevotella sp.]|nr:four helix bundle suffix domain-containing protein [Prevotella sp.]MBO6254705.1 four helix bundle suffix domain-containing protein [Bacteroidaceae bacterium]
MDEKSIFRRVPNYKELHVYQKAEVLVLLTDVFCKRFLPLYGDRRVDQMNMAARCGKQNIVEGCEDAMTSSAMEVNLVNVGRSSFQELREDYEDYLKRNNLEIWDKNHPRFDKMVKFCRQNNHWDAYQPLSETLSAEDFCNMALTLCHITDKMFCGYLAHLEKTFKEQGGVKERMHAVRTGYRQEQDARMKALEAENAALKAENAALKQRIAELEKKIGGH